MSSPFSYALIEGSVNAPAAAGQTSVDSFTDKINGKIQRAEQMKVHTMLVIVKRDSGSERD